MIVMVYVGILSLCYGIYNILCYFCILPTAAAGRNIVTFGRKRRRLHSNVFFIGLSGKIVKKWQMKWNGSEKIAEPLRYNRIYYPVTVYIASLILTALCGLFLCLPLLLWDVRLFGVLAVEIIILVLAEPVLLFGSYRKHIDPVKHPDLSEDKKQKWAQKPMKLLPGVFLLCQILLFISLLT